MSEEDPSSPDPEPCEPMQKRHLLSGFQHWLHGHPHFRVALGLVGVVMLWRGVWAICDRVLFPHHPIVSYLTSIVLGLALLLIDDFKLGELHESSESPPEESPDAPQPSTEDASSTGTDS